MKFLIIEDDLDVVDVLSLILESRWPDAAISHSPFGELGIQLAETEEPEVIILDIGLPDIDGFEVCSRIREFSIVPIVMLTVRNSTEDVIRGLELGADDYITKPFRPAELVARIGAILSRVESTHLKSESRVIHHRGMALELRGGQFIAGDEYIRLSLTEYQLLYHLAGSQEKPIPSAFLLSNIWGEEYRDSPHYLTSSITRLKETLNVHPYTQGLTLRDELEGYLLLAANDSG